MNQAALELEFASALGVITASGYTTVPRGTATFSAGDIVGIYANETGTMEWDNTVGYFEVVFDN